MSFPYLYTTLHQLIQEALAETKLRNWISIETKLRLTFWNYMYNSWQSRELINLCRSRCWELFPSLPYLDPLRVYFAQHHRFHALKSSKIFQASHPVFQLLFQTTSVSVSFFLSWKGGKWWWVARKRKLFNYESPVCFILSQVNFKLIQLKASNFRSLQNTQIDVVRTLENIKLHSLLSQKVERVPCKS